MAWLQANWMQVLLLLLAVDNFLIGVFPSQPIFGTIGGFLKALTGSQPPALK